MICSLFFFFENHVFSWSPFPLPLIFLRCYCTWKRLLYTKTSFILVINFGKKKKRLFVRDTHWNTWLLYCHFSRLVALREALLVQKACSQKVTLTLRLQYTSLSFISQKKDKLKYWEETKNTLSSLETFLASFSHIVRFGKKKKKNLRQYLHIKYVLNMWFLSWMGLEKISRTKFLKKNTKN